MYQQTVEVSLAERSYEICLGQNLLADSIPGVWQELLQKLHPIKHAVVVADKAVGSSIAEPIHERLRESGLRVSTMDVPSGESSKSVEQLTRLWSNFLSFKTDRKSVVFAVGGGVIGDLVGFAAASYVRGLRFVQVPTTLLAMVDSSVGGKTGINLPDAKNIVGAFWQPHAVLIDSMFLDTLPEREYVSGLAEVVKYGVIMSDAFFERLECLTSSLMNREPQTLLEIIATSCRCKAEVVRDDERETTGRRAILNYGHTFAHAIEATVGYGKLLHGEAVSIGMAMAGKLAVTLGLFTTEELDRQNSLLQRLHLPVDYTPYPLETLWEAMQSDKKVELGKLGFILPTKIGSVQRFEGIDFATVQAALA